MMDLVLEGWMSGLIELARLRWILGAPDSRWRPGEKLKLLFAGYNGTRNTGADVRVEEMLRQIRHVLGPDKVELSVLTQNFDFSEGYFEGTKQVKLPDVFPPFLWREVPRYHGVVACEGSMFKSKFANALTTMMIGALGIAAAENKISIGYGAEAGAMDPILRKMVKRYCSQSLIITRNEESAALLGHLGVPTEVGTDTAWTFESHGPEYGEAVLRQVGWDGRLPVLVLCPINPYWWPVKPSLVKYALTGLTGLYRKSQYRTIYFHRWGREVLRAFDRYLRAWAQAVRVFVEKSPAFVLLVAMERLDQSACHRLADLLRGCPVLTSEDYNMYELVSVLRKASLLVSSRYHAIVTSMPALVPSAGVTMDERIRNLMHERGHDHLVAEVDDPDLGDKLVEMLKTLNAEREAIVDGIGRTVARNLKMMARMGVAFEEHVKLCYPDFPTRTGTYSWEEYLPSLGPLVRRVAEVYC